jgi:hypothetical protein
MLVEFQHWLSAMIEYPHERARRHLWHAVDDLLAVVVPVSTETTDRMAAMRLTLLHLRPLLELLQADPELRHAIEELETAYDDRRSRLRAAELEWATEAETLRDQVAEHLSRLPRVPESEDADDADGFPSGPFVWMNRSLGNLREAADFAEMMQPEYLRIARELTHQLHRVLGWDDDDDAHPVRALYKRSMSLRVRERLHHREKLVAWLSDPGARWKWLRRMVSAINPDPLSPEDSGHLALWFDLRFDPRVFLFNDETLGHEDIEDETTHDKVIARAPEVLRAIADNVRAVATAVDAKLGLRASVAWVLRRYAQRCRQFRLQEYRDRIDREKHLKEPMLTLDAAAYLFDQGFEAVAVEVRSGPLRQDVVARIRAAIDPPLLVEGKVYKKSPIKAVVDGLRQLHGYASALRSGEAPFAELVLVIYRLAGPTLNLPRYYEMANDLRVWLITVDLGPSEESGSRAGATVDVTTDDIEAALNANRRRSPRSPVGRGRQAGSGGRAQPRRRSVP